MFYPLAESGGALRAHPSPTVADTAACGRFFALSNYAGPGLLCAAGKLFGHLKT
jgi:hypothetical protein